MWKIHLDDEPYSSGIQRELFTRREETQKPLHVIYQCSEDGISDTIKPRLLNAGADCNNVAFLDEETDWITLNDEKIRRAIADFNAKLLVIDPVQAYLGETDIASAAAMRKSASPTSSLGCYV